MTQMQSSTVPPALVRRAQSGNLADLNLLLEENRPHLLRHARGCCGDCGLAEDLCQETCLKVVARLSELRQPEAFAAWARGILTNEIRHCRRKCRKVGTAGQEIGTDQIEGMVAEEIHELTAEVDELVEDLRRRGGRPDQQRGRIAVFMLDYFSTRHELPTIRKIASETGASQGTAQRHRDALLQTWRRALRAMGILPILIGQVWLFREML